MRSAPRTTVTSVIVLLALLSLSCSLERFLPATPTVTPTVTDVDLDGSPTWTVTPTAPDSDLDRPPTPTPTTALPGVPTVSPEPTAAPASRPERGEIELRFTDPETQEECEAHFPFRISWEGDLGTLEGGGAISCGFAIQQCGEGVCVTYHSAYDLDGALNGVIEEATTDYPHGTLRAGLGGTFSMKQYWTDIPPETVMPFTKENPFVAESADILPLLFDFVEGATCVIGSNTPEAFPWVFTLHLEE